MVLARLGRLFVTGENVLQWAPVIAIAIVLGILVRWLLAQTRIPAEVAGALMVVGAVILFLRVTVAHTLESWLIPSEETWPEVVDQLQVAVAIFRSGVPPVTPTPGLIGVLAALMWLLGATYTVGALSRRVSLMVLPTGILYLQLAVLDRLPVGLPWYAATAIVVGLAVSALAMENREQVGHTRALSGRPKPSRSAVAAAGMAGCVAIVAVFGTASAAPMVSEYGNLPWRSQGWEGGLGEGIAFDRFIELRQRLQSRQNAVVFEATFPEGAPVPASSLYWRMETLDNFDGTGWRRSPSPVRAYTPGTATGDPGHRYRGTTVSVNQRVTIDRLIGQLVPTAGNPISILDVPGEINLARVAQSRDGSINYAPGLTNGLTYQLTAEYPNMSADLGALATGPDGQLSPLFAAAAEAGLFNFAADATPRNIDRPTGISDYLAMPAGTPVSLGAIARIRTAGAATDFERAWMLQHWFRDSGDFTYSLNVTTGSQALNLVDWLTIPSSPNYRTGYCEQFAASMAILARTLGIPSRVVWGFAPGSPTGEAGQIQVRDTNAHAWVELWIDGFGWVMFEPTPRSEFLPQSSTAAFDPGEFIVEPEDPSTGQPVVPEIPVPTIQDPEPVELDRGGGVDERGPISVFPVVVVALGLGLVLIRLGKQARRERRIRRLSEGDVTAAWEEIVDRLRDLGETLDPSMTPIELADATVPELGALARSYSASVYGGKTGLGTPTLLADAEDWIDLSYDRGRRIKGSMNPRSLFTKRPRQGR
jgi:transglutaminase-like putative cysteine protease